MSSGTHTLYVATDNDFVPNAGNPGHAAAGPSTVYAFSVNDTDLGGSTFQQQAVPEPSSALLLASGLGLLSFRR